MNPQPKPVKRSTVKARTRRVKNAHIQDVRAEVEQLDGERCRVGALLRRFGFSVLLVEGRLELAHIAARGMGGNPDLSRDTPENTILVRSGLHTGPRTLHSGHLKIRPLTEKGTRGPCCFEFYEQLPTEL